jgi:3',5'-cyclic AMP phosphodiesterase CpdA
MKDIVGRRKGGQWSYLFFVAVLGALLAGTAPRAKAQVTIAQISDTHLGEAEAPNAAENLRRTVEMVNARHPDAVVLSGDIGENPEEWERAREILRGLRAPLYYAPGNHDVHSRDVERYRAVFGPDYYRFQVKGVTFLVIDSQLLGNFDQFEARSPQPLPPETEAEAEKMLGWLAEQGTHNAGNRRRHWWSRGRADAEGDGPSGGAVIAIQHIPAARGDNLPPDSKPYWVINDPYRARELDLLRRLGVRHVLAGHWHVGTVFERDGITWHVAPSVGRLLPWSGNLGFAMHTISRDGEVKTEFVPLETGP